MTPTLTRWLAATAACGALTAAVLLLPGPGGYAQAPKAATPKAGGPVSAIHCRSCHAGPMSEDEEKRNPEGFAGFREYKRQGVTEFVRLNESGTWAKDDLHAVAHKNIEPAKDPDGTRNLALQMQDILQPHRPAEYEVHKAAECLTCHAVDLTAGQGVALKDKRPEHFQTTYGVSCEACHGFAENWFAPHVLETWRTTDPKIKEGLGLVDLRDPYTRAMKCASCHVGNKAEGKFVTHEMYAAGHPPLPPFEVVTFANDAPRHYMPHRENKALAAMGPAAAWKNFHYRENECADARALAFGTVATFEATMQLLADDAAATAKSGELLDFAHFDCFACHHDLKVPSVRPKRGIPGRPTMRPWETLQSVLQHSQTAPGIDTEKVTKTAGDIRDGLVALHKGLDLKPFGQPGQIAEQARGLVGPCQALKDELAPLVYDPAQTEALYRMLADRLRKADGLDHDTAQHMIWSLRVLQEELRASKAHDELEKITPFHVRGPKREPVAGERLKMRLERVGKFDPALFLPRALEWLKEQP